MARNQKTDFALAKEEERILKGLVRSCEKNEFPDGKVEWHINVAYNGQSVIITEDDVINFPYAKTLVSLVGEEISFVIKDVISDDLVYGDMKKAYEIKRKPIMDKLMNGQVLEGIVVYTLPHGAYINISGVQGFLKNYDFSNDDTKVSDIYPQGSFIRVKFLRYTKNGNILFTPEKKIERKSSFDVSTIKKGQRYVGKIVDIYPDRLYVNITAGVDCLCSIPQTIANPKINDTVMIKVSKVFYGDNGKMYVRGYISNRIEGDII